MKLFRYNDWITESKLELLLEANMDFSEEFIATVAKVKSPLSEKILKLYKNDVDVDANYIELSDKENFLLFKSDKRVESTCIIEQPNYIYRKESKDLFPEHKKFFKKKDFASLLIYDKLKDISGRIVSEIKSDDERISDKLKRDIERGRTFYHIKFNYDGNEYDAIVHEFGIKKGPKYVKSQEIRVGSFVQTLLRKAGEKFTPQELEDFVIKFNNEVKAKKENLFKNFEIVKGDDIKKYYLQGNYESGNHTLGGSCMRYSRCQPYLNIYSKNPGQVSLVILRSDEDPEKIKGRALLWNAYYLTSNQDDYNGKLFMDRIYTNNSKDEELFKKFAIERGFVYKKTQNYSKSDFMFGDELTPIGEIQVKIENSDYARGEFQYYPYIDTLTFYNPSKMILSNVYNGGWELEHTDGTNGTGCETCDGEERVECPECYGDGEVECPDCEGNGEVDCSECGGNGKEECSSCDGTGLDDEDNECSNCQGDGEMSCGECEGSGKEECSRCGGDCMVECRECGGNGRVDCPDC